MQEENENEAGGEDAEEIFTVDNPSLDLEVHSSRDNPSRDLEVHSSKDNHSWNKSSILTTKYAGVPGQSFFIARKVSALITFVFKSTARSDL